MNIYIGPFMINTLGYIDTSHVFDMNMRLYYLKIYKTKIEAIRSEHPLRALRCRLTKR